MMWRIKNWDDVYENNRSRELQKTQWVPIPNKQDGDGYLALLEHENGPAHYGAFVALVLLASKCDRRGTLVRSNGIPHTVESIAAKTHMPAALVDSMLKRCMDDKVGWVEWVSDDADSAAKNPDLFDETENYNRSQAGAGLVRDQCGFSATPSARNGNGKGIRRGNKSAAAGAAASPASRPSEPDPASAPAQPQQQRRQQQDSSSGEVVMEFPTLDGPGNWPLQASLFNQLCSLFPGLDGKAEITSALARVSIDARNRKKASEMPQFLEKWFRRSANNPQMRARSIESEAETKRRGDAGSLTPRRQSSEDRFEESIRAKLAGAAS